jgi:hypothetical protein
VALKTFLHQSGRTYSSRLLKGPRDLGGLALAYFFVWALFRDDAKVLFSFYKVLILDTLPYP